MRWWCNIVKPLHNIGGPAISTIMEQNPVIAVGPEHADLVASEGWSKDDFKKAFEQVDLIVAPTAPSTAFGFGEKTDDPLMMYLSDIFTISANLAGIPGLAVPCGFSSQGLPIGLQLMGKHFDEATLFQVAYNFEQATDFHTRKPKMN